MANPELKHAEETLHDAKERVADAAERARDVAADLYDQAQAWLEESGPRAIGAAAIIAAVGIVGYMIGRNHRS
jgi:ElaB/YqjD/DUF883 family membrane-anchored ribosome-binding protein